jgi:hypothetical protein
VGAAVAIAAIVSTRGSSDAKPFQGGTPVAQYTLYKPISTFDISFDQKATNTGPRAACFTVASAGNVSTCEATTMR